MHVLSHFSHVQLIVTLWTIAHQPSLSMGFSRQGYWSGLPCPPSRGSSQPRDWTHVSKVSCIDRWVLYHQCHLGSPKVYKIYIYFQHKKNACELLLNEKKKKRHITEHIIFFCKMIPMLKRKDFYIKVLILSGKSKSRIREIISLHISCTCFI